MAKCRKCSNEVSPARVRVVGKLCLECGDEVAKRLTEQRKQQSAPIFNKGGYQYITERDLKDLGK